MVLESVSSLYDIYAIYFTIFELISVVIFTCEYSLRIWASGAQPSGAKHSFAKGRLKYIFSFHSVIDLVAILPFYLQVLLPGLDLRVLRILRLLKFARCVVFSFDFVILQHHRELRFFYSATEIWSKAAVRFHRVTIYLRRLEANPFIESDEFLRRIPPPLRKIPPLFRSFWEIWDLYQMAPQAKILVIWQRLLLDFPLKIVI